MRKIVALVVAVLLLGMFAWLWLRLAGGVSHRDICDAVRGESGAVQERIERRYQDLDRRLDRIEGKLDRLLKIAERPLPDGMREAE